ncbi:MAG: hypothetical protein AAGA09_09385 [Pseudomonadota bacterium]
MSEHLHPPRPALAIRIGVTGHRAARIGADAHARLDAQIGAVLDALFAGAHDAALTLKDLYREEEPRLSVVSALADGADMMVAERALEKGWRLFAPLPFSPNLYERDFAPADKPRWRTVLKQAESVLALDGRRETPADETASYAGAGDVLVGQSDILIAIWDGAPARGPGGTAAVKDASLAAGKPVVWINAEKDASPLILDSQGGAHDFSPAGAARLMRNIAGLSGVRPDASSKSAGTVQETSQTAAYDAFIRETPRRFSAGAFHRFWERLFAGRQPFRRPSLAPTIEETIAEARKNSLAAAIDAPARDREVFDKILDPRFSWADRLAVYYSDLYRSSYFFNYLAAALAVFLALFELVVGFGAEIIWVSLEVTLIMLILAVTLLGKRGRWHDKWIDYRQLAEELRQLRHLFLTASRGAQGPLGTQNTSAPAESARASMTSWVAWYVAATARETGMKAGAFDAATLRAIARAIAAREVRPQIAYHEGKGALMRRIEERLNAFGEYAFAATLFMCVVYLGVVIAAASSWEGAPAALQLQNAAEKWVTLFTGFLPALGAAFFGIRVQGEFGSAAERSTGAAHALRFIAERFDAIAEDDAPRLSDLQNSVNDGADAMLHENRHWRTVYEAKPLNLPG